MSITQMKKMLLQRKILPLILALLSVLLLATGFMFAHKKVHVTADGTTKVINTLHVKPENVLAQAGIVLGANDEFKISTTKLTDGTAITVYRAVPVNITYQGKTETILTAKQSVGDLAEYLGLKKESIKLVPDEQSRIEAGMNIQVVTLSEKIVERDVVEHYQIVRTPDSSLEKGVEKLSETGQDGVKTLTVKLHFADGVEVGAETIGENIKEAPKPQVIKVGTRDTVETSRGTMRFSRTAMMEATAYLPTDGSGSGITATGVRARHGVVAVDPSVIPLGTRLYVQGYGMALAADTGGDIVGNRIDLCMEGYGEAWGFGRRMVKVYILE